LVGKPYVRIPVWWVRAAADAVRSEKALLLAIELVYTAWRGKSPTFLLPNGHLAELGVSRDVKRQALVDLEGAGLISVERRPSKNPIVTVKTE
jgi:hypothetical protein